MSRAIVIAGGGTGGHIFPGLALAEELKRRRPQRVVQWIGARGGLEERLVPRAGLPLTLLPMSGLARAGVIGALRATTLAALATLRLLLRFVGARPALLVGVGGFASGPAVLAAALLGVPTLLLEQNAIAGATNRWLSRFASATAASFESSRDTLNGRVVLTGNPVRAEIGALPELSSVTRSRVLAFGGSRGAQALNEVWNGAIPELSSLGAEFLIQTGPADHPRLQQTAGDSPGIQIVPFIDDMPAQLGAATLVVARAGATTVAELTAAGRGAILIPFPQAANDHQRANARALAAAGAAIVIEQSELSATRLLGELRALLADPARLLAMADAARRFGRADATARVADLADELIGAGA